MRQENRDKRRLEIEEAAYALLEERGYGGATMQAIALRAGTSNETLYRWYGGKQGLFLALVERNASSVRELLEKSVHSDVPLEAKLEAVGRKLLGLLVNKRAIALNRAAAADPSGELGQALGAGGREAVLPMIVQLFERHAEGDAAPALPPDEAAEAFVSLLVRDLQLRTVTGAIAAPDARQIARRAQSARALTLRLLQA